MHKTDTLITQNSFLTLHYQIETTDEKVLISTFHLTSATIQIGSGQLSPNLEKVLLNYGENDEDSVLLEAHEAFGVKNPDLIKWFSQSILLESQKRPLSENQPITFRSQEGHSVSGYIVELKDDKVLVDFNHPFAGQSIIFRFKIISVL